MPEQRWSVVFELEHGFKAVNGIVGEDIDATRAKLAGHRAGSAWVSSNIPYEILKKVIQFCGRLPDHEARIWNMQTGEEIEWDADGNFGGI